MLIGAEVQRHASTLLSPLQNVLSDILPGSREPKGIGLFYIVLYFGLNGTIRKLADTENDLCN